MNHELVVHVTSKYFEFRLTCIAVKSLMNVFAFQVYPRFYHVQNTKDFNYTQQLRACS